MYRIALATFVAALAIALGAGVSTRQPSAERQTVRLRPLGAARRWYRQRANILARLGRGRAAGLSRVSRDRVVAELKALFVHPASGGPWPLVIWSPGAGGDRRQQLPEAVDLARGGAASLLIDEAPLGNCRDAQHEVDLHVSYVISRRRAVDVAETLPNVDTNRIAASGFSRGAAVTAALAGVEHRIHTFVLRSGRGHLTGYVPIFCTNLGPSRTRAIRRDTRRGRPGALAPQGDRRGGTPPERHQGRALTTRRRARSLRRGKETQGASLVPGRPRPQQGGNDIPHAVAAPTPASPLTEPTRPRQPVIRQGEKP